MYAAPTSDQATAIRNSGISFPFLWAVVKEFPQGIVLINRITKETRFVYMPKMTDA